MKKTIVSLLLIGITFISFGQKKDLTLEDAELGYYQGLYPTHLFRLQWMPSGQSYSYTKGDSIVFVNLKGQKSYLGKDAVQKADTSLKNLPRFSWLDDATGYYFKGNSIRNFNKTSNQGAVLLSFPEDAENQDYCESKNLLAYTIENNLFIANEKESRVTVFASKNKDIVSGQAIHRFEFGISKGTFWSPQGNALAFYQKDETDVANYPLLDINTTPGSLRYVKYPMAGQKSEYAKVGVYNTSTGNTIFLETGEPKDHFLTNLAWSPDEKYIFLAEVNRDQNHMWLNQYDAKTGKKMRTLFEEQNTEWTEPENPVSFIPNSTTEFLWLSEQDGFMNLYHFNTEGRLIKQLTSFKWVVTGILGYSSDGKNVYIEGTGNDPRELHAYSVNIETGAVSALTKEKGTHHVQISSDSKYLLDSWSSTDVPAKVDLVSMKKMTSKNIFTTENPLNDYNVAQVEYLTLKSKDGFDLYGRIMKPHDFDPAKKYPVLVYVYGGPHAQLVTNDWLGGARLWMHWMAEQGYIVFTLDGRGSANRGYDFEKVIHRHLGNAEMEDQLIGVDYLKSLTYIDSDRMAVHGWSFGGFMTTSLMLRNAGIFNVGVAGGPVIDWKWYEVMYGERYMDTPEQNPDGYKEASLLNYVKNLEGKLLMIHGTVDDVVVMQHNLAFVQECVSEGVQIDFFPYPMHEHNVRGKDRVHLMTKILTYILDNNH